MRDHERQRLRAGTMLGRVRACGWLLALMVVACMAAGPASAQPAGQADAPDVVIPDAAAPDTAASDEVDVAPDDVAPDEIASDAAASDAGDVVIPDEAASDAGTATRAPDAGTRPAWMAEPEVVMEPGVLATLGAVFPGVLVHGTGHRIGGDARTANRLLRGELLALGIAAAGGVPLGLTGASRRLALPTVALVLSGGGMLLLNWGADIYGAAGLGRVAGTPRLTLPALEARLGYLYVNDPQFAYSSFANPGVRLRRGRWHVDVDALLALDDDNQRLRVGGGRRFFGPLATGAAATAAAAAGAAPDGLAPDGSALGVDAAITVHRYGSDDFMSLLGEVVGRGRYDLARFAPSLAGAFAEMWLGLGLEVVRYDHGTDPTDWLLGGFGFGMYLGEPAATHGEVRVYYDHFRGELGGGLAVPGGASGYWGRLGLDGFVAVRPRWGVSFRAEAGSAYLGGLGLVYRRP